MSCIRRMRNATFEPGHNCHQIFHGNKKVYTYDIYISKAEFWQTSVYIYIYMYVVIAIVYETGGVCDCFHFKNI